MSAIRGRRELERTPMMNKLALLLLMTATLGCTDLYAQSYEILFDTDSASGWFGGDNRTGMGPRDVGNGQSVLIESSIILLDFSFYFTGRFDYAENPDGSGHEVTLVLNIRDAVGDILQTEQLVLPETFEGGWGTWSDIDLNVEANTLLIFSCYLVGAYDSDQYRNGIRADADAGYLDGVRYVKEGNGDSDMELWEGWSVHPWDANFWLQGVEQVEATNGRPQAASHRFTLHQNYPNPFNPATTCAYSLEAPGSVEFSLFNLSGQLVDTIQSGFKAAGYHTVEWIPGDLPSGIYLLELKAAGCRDVLRISYLK